jgi:DNA-binding Lrp family transcriptional regulator
MTIDLNNEVLDSLYADADRSRKELAHSLKISEPSLSKRISTLKLSGEIKNFSINIDYDRVGYNTNSITLIRLPDQKKDVLDNIVQRLMKMNEAVEVYTILGEWDLYVRWLCKSNAQVMEFIRELDDMIPRSVPESRHFQVFQTITLAQQHKREHGPRLSSKPDGK